MQSQCTVDNPHDQFTKKFLQLSQISEKIDCFIQTYKNKNNDHTQHANLRNNKNILNHKLTAIKDHLHSVKEQFVAIRNDLFVCAQIPKEFVRMVVQIPALYDGLWQTKEQEHHRQISILTQENQMLKQKLVEKDQEVQQLKTKLQQQKLTKSQIFQPQHHLLHQPHQLLSNTRIPPPQPTTQFQQNFSNTTGPTPSPLAHLPHHSFQKQFEEQDLDSYINNMEITIRQNDEPLFKKITQQCSQEEEEEESCQYERQREAVRRNVTARSDLILEDNGDDRIRKASEASILYEQKKQKLKQCQKPPTAQDQNTNRNTFWNKLSKTLSSKTKSRKSLSQSKQNIYSKQVSNLSSINPSKISNVDRKILTSKITDFRRLLFVEKGMQRLGFKIQNVI